MGAGRGSSKRCKRGGGKAQEVVRQTRSAKAAPNRTVIRASEPDVIVDAINATPTRRAVASVLSENCAGTKEPTRRYTDAICRERRKAQTIQRNHILNRCLLLSAVAASVVAHYFEERGECLPVSSGRRRKMLLRRQNREKEFERKI